MLEGKTALITGSVRGIGEAAARALAGQGCNIMLNGLGEPDAIERTRGAIASEYSVEVAYHGADLSRRNEVEDLVKSTESRFGALDILINNAVIRHYDTIVDFKPANWDHALAVNLTAPFDLTRLALPGMKARGWGRIINLSSIMGLTARTGRVDYITCKTALIGLTRATAAETLRDPNVTCNAICPGSVLTDFIRARIQKLADEKGIGWDEMAVRYRADLGQIADFITPEQIADAMLYLCREESRHISGTALPVDGGLVATWLENPDEM